MIAQSKAEENTLGVSEGLSTLSLEKKDAEFLQNMRDAEFLEAIGLEQYIPRIIDYG